MMPRTTRRVSAVKSKSASLMLLFAFVTTISVHAQELQELKERLLSDDADMRMKALVTLQGLDDSAKAQLIPYLVEKARDSRSISRFYASHALGYLGAPAVPELLKLLHDPQTDLRHRASQALSMVGEPAIPALLSALGEPDNDVRCSAARALGQMSGTKTQAAVPDLVPLSKDPDAKLRACVAEVFGRVGGPGALKSLIPLLSDSEKEVRWAALNALNPFGPSAREAVPNVLPLAKDHDSLTREIAYRTLGNIGRGDAEVVETLRSAVRNEKSGNAIAALGELGPDAASAVPDLVKALNGASSYLSGTIALSLGKIGPAAKDAAPALMELWVHPDPFVRTQAIEAVTSIGPVAIPALVAALKDKNADIRAGAAWQLGEFRDQAASAVPSLLSLLQDEEGPVRMNAVQALARIGTPEAKAAAGNASTGRSNPWTVEGKRLWTKAEIATPIPPSEGQRNALRLYSEVRIPAPGGATLLATIHRGDGRADFLAVWRPVGDRFERVVLEGWDEAEAELDEPQYSSLAPPTPFQFRGEQFLNVERRFPGTAALHEDTFYWIAPDLSLHRIGFQPAAQGYSGLKKGEGIWKGEMNKFTDDRMEFEFFIWNEGDGNCCPTAGHVKGEYKLLGEKKFDPVRRTWSADFRIVPSTHMRMAVERQ